MISRNQVLALVIVALATLAPGHARANGWADSLSQTTQLANAAHKAGNVDGAKSVVLAGLPMFLNIMQQNAMHIAKNKNAAEGFNAAAEAIYKGHPIADNSAAFQGVLAKHGPALLEFAEVMADPNGNPRNQLAMLLRAQQQQEKIRAALIAYVQAAPGPAAHLKEPKAKDVLAALRTIVTGMVEMEPRKQRVIKEAIATGEEVAGWAEGSLKKDDLFKAMVHAGRAAEISEGLLAIDSKLAAGTKIGARAKEVTATVATKYAARVAKNRLPEAGYKGGGAAALDGELLALYKKTYPTEKPLKVVVVSPDWNVEVRADWHQGSKQWVVTRYKMLAEIAVTVVRKDGKKDRYWVNFMRAYKVWDGKKFGPTQMTAIGNWMPYEILKEHAM